MEVTVYFPKYRRSLYDCFKGAVAICEKSQANQAVQTMLWIKFQSISVVEGIRKRLYLSTEHGGQNTFDLVASIADSITLAWSVAET